MRLNLFLEKNVQVAVFYALLLLVFLFSIEQSSAKSYSPQEVPGLYLERERDKGASLIPSLKMKYSLCVMQKNIAKTEFLNKSDAWNEMKKTLSPEYISFISKPPRSEPDWSRAGIGVTREKEYFYGDKYKKINDGKKFRISKKDGLCRLESYGEYEKQLIDDGKHRYKVTLKHKSDELEGGYKSIKVRRSTSPVLLRKRMGMEDEVLLEKNSKKLVGLIQKETQIDFLSFPDAGAGSRLDKIDQLCNKVESVLTKGSICYWDQMSIYPSVMERPIILKTEQKVFQKNVQEKTVRFELHSEFKDAVFEPPSKR